jgi:hypothetical protein
MTTRISTLPSLATVTDATIIPVVEGGATKRITGLALKTYTGTASGPQGPSGPSGAAGSAGASGPSGPSGPGTLNSGTAGYIPYYTASTTLSAPTSGNLYWDNTNVRLGIGTTSPGYAITTSGGNATSEPASLIRATRVYNQHPGKTDFNSIYGSIEGFHATSMGSSAGVYGYNTLSYGGAGVTGDGSGGVTAESSGVVGVARHGNTDGYAINNALYARCDLPTAGGGNGGVRGLYIKLPNYAKSYGIQYQSDYTGSNTQSILQIYRNGADIGSITTTASATAYNTASDYRLKENPVKITTGLADVMRMNPVKFAWRSNGTEGIGFIAHELQVVVPQAVHGTKDEVKLVPELDSNGVPLLDADGRNIVKTEPVYQGVDSSFLVATLVAAIQELKAEFDAYKSAHP